MRTHPSFFLGCFVVIVNIVGFYFCSSSYWVQLWSIKVQLTPPENTVAVVVLDIIFDVVVVADVLIYVVTFVNVVVLALLVVTDHIFFTCGQ